MPSFPVTRVTGESLRPSRFSLLAIHSRPPPPFKGGRSCSASPKGVTLGNSEYPGKEKPTTCCLLRCVVSRSRYHTCDVIKIRREHLHLLPVVRKLTSAIEAHDVGAGQSSRPYTSFVFSCGDREGVVLMPAAEEQVDNGCNHPSRVSWFECLLGSFRFRP